MSKLINRSKSVEITARISKEINSSNGVKFPNTIFLELGDNHPVLQLITSSPDQFIEVENYEEFIMAWDRLNLEERITGLRYPEQIEILGAHIQVLGQLLGLTITPISAGLMPAVPIIERTFWFDYCYAIDAQFHVSDIFVEVKRPTRIMGECELSPGLMEAIDLGIIDSNANIADIIVGKDHERLYGKEAITPTRKLSESTEKRPTPILGELKLPWYSSVSVTMGHQHFQLFLLDDARLGIVGKDLEEAKKLYLSLTDNDLQLYMEKGVATKACMRFSLLLLEAGFIEPTEGYTSEPLDGKLFLLRLYDIDKMAKENSPDYQRIITLAKHRLHKKQHGSSSTYKLCLMKDNVKAHEYFLGEMDKLAYYTSATDSVKRMNEIFYAMIGAKTLSQEQMNIFHFDLGENLVAEVPCPVDRDNWMAIQNLMQHALFTIMQGNVHGQDVQELGGAYFNGQTLGKNLADKGEYVSIHRREDLDAFYIVPLAHWYRAK